jgi:lipopolysaccharide heptosyltransferase I
MQRILIVKTSAIGDVIHAFSAIDYLKQRFPDAQIDWVVEKASSSFLSSHPFINRVIVIDTKKWRKQIFNPLTWKEMRKARREIREVDYDALFDMQGNIKSALFTFWARAQRKIGFSFASAHEKVNALFIDHKVWVDRRQNIRNQYLGLIMGFLEKKEEHLQTPLQLKITSEEEARLNEILSDHHLNKSPRFMVCFGSRWPNKQLDIPTLCHFLHLIKKELGPSLIFIFGSPEEKTVAEQLSAEFKAESLVVGNLSLPLWQVLMSRIDCVLTIDSAALHLCATTGTPSFSVFGPSKAEIYKPPGKMHEAVQGPCPYGRTFVKHCPILRTCKTGLCLKGISADTLSDEFLRFWRKLHF